MSSANSSAYPKYSRTGSIAQSSGGMTKREAAAIAAMQGIVSKHGGSPADIAEHAVELADALFEELDKLNPNNLNFEGLYRQVRGEDKDGEE